MLWGGRYQWYEYLPHNNSCLWIYALNTMKISRTEVNYWLDTMESHCTWRSVCCVTVKYKLPLGVVTRLDNRLRGELELASVGANRDDA
jgi:hypothetical protein